MPRHFRSAVFAFLSSVLLAGCGGEPPDENTADTPVPGTSAGDAPTTGNAAGAAPAPVDSAR